MDSLHHVWYTPKPSPTMLLLTPALDTTRAPRPGEINGQHYHFVSRPEFESLITSNYFIEHASFNNNLYGTSFAAITALQSRGVTPLLDIEIQGVKNVKAHPDWSGRSRFLFLSPPSLETLEARLKGRGDTSTEEVEGRMRQAKVDMEAAREKGLFDKVVVNDDREKACREFEEWVLQG